MQEGEGLNLESCLRGLGTSLGREGCQKKRVSG